jgi:hypothetical protein
VRVIALELCVAIAALLFLAMMAGVARHGARQPSSGGKRAAALSDLVWAAVPWALVVGGALPAIRVTLAQG